uniref:AtC3H23-like CCCH zinc finger domain-containing protein n=2 Tax=Physcomitrium patens TaxID=3218 RepID=A0A2K1JSW7_PHYPA|nr:hypothetical protein PHYPA_014389 [Physcomitrium patens]
MQPRKGGRERYGVKRSRGLRGRQWQFCRSSKLGFRGGRKKVTVYEWQSGETGIAGRRSLSSPSLYESMDDYMPMLQDVRRCRRGKSHDWTEGRFAHPSDEARHCNMRRYDNSGTACMNF